MFYNNPFTWPGPLPFSEIHLFGPVTHTCPSPIQGYVEEGPSGYKIQYSVPGMNKKGIRAKIDNGKLVVEGHQKGRSSKLFGKDNNWTETLFAKVVALTEDMDVDNLKAKFKSGTLTIEIPKMKGFIQYREIPVRGSDVTGEAKTVESHKTTNIFESAKSRLQTIFNKSNKKKLIDRCGM